MTRTYASRPIWTWQCDDCGTETEDLAREQSGLPSIEVMRSRGWFIAETFGDKCPACLRKSGSSPQALNEYRREHAKPHDLPTGEHR